MSFRQVLERAMTMTIGRIGSDDNNLMTLSQTSSYSKSGDISDIIATMDTTQILRSDGSVSISTLPNSGASSSTSSRTTLTSSDSLLSIQLGKRKAGSPPNLASPTKVARTASAIIDENNPCYISPAVSKKSQDDRDTSVIQSNEPVIIAHSDHHQQCFDSRGLSYGVQYEIARLASCGVLKYEDIKVPDLDRLKGPNSIAAPKTAEVLHLHLPDERNEKHATAFAKELAAKSPWEELDTEEKNLKADIFSGLGFSKENPDWYGGRVVFRAKLLEPSSGRYKIILERAELGPSCRFARRFGSTSFLRVRIPPNAFKSERVVSFFLRPFVLNGCVFRSFFAKEEDILLFRTNEQFLGSQIHTPPAGSPGMSLLVFLNWHNPLESNRKQTLTKWSSRFALGLSTSVPGVRVAEQDILPEDDIISPKGADMTDGCGYINRFPLRLMQNRFEWEDFPTAIQCRIEGSKGLLMRPDTRDDDQVVPIVRIRHSQVKIRYPKDRPQDPAMLILDLLLPSRLKTPVRLSHEVLVNLAENGVPCDVFGQLFMSGLTELVERLMTWNDPIELWRTVAQKGFVMSARRGRDAGTESRARGYGERDWDDGELDDEDGQIAEKALRTKSSAWWWDEVSGSPSSLEETVMVLLDAGFVPETCAVLREKLKMIVETSIRTQRRIRVEVPMSCTAFIVPDPLNVLGPREVHIRSSRRNLKNRDGPETDLVLGDVLLARNPCKLPTDVQKFRAVDKPELRHLTDVIVCSVQGDRRQADLLAGGDYDGDRAQAIWQPEIVDRFIDADIKYSVKPKTVEGWFDNDPLKVGDFLEQMAAAPESKLVSELQKVLLGAIGATAMVAKYSMYHENAIYGLGYNLEQTMELAWGFCDVLDAAKTGLRMKIGTLRDHSKKWSTTLGPKWKDKVEEKKKGEKRGRDVMDNKPYLKRPRQLGRFVMDEITELAEQMANQQLAKLVELFNTFKSTMQPDSDLIDPWLKAVKMAKRYTEEEGSNRMQRDLEAIANHVRRIRVKHREQIRGAGPMSPRKENRGALFTELPIEMRQDKIRALSQEFASWPGPEDVLMEESEMRRVRASFAYYHDTVEVGARNGELKWTRFPFDVAMRDLCAIKARSTGLSKTVTSSFYDRFFLK